MDSRNVARDLGIVTSHSASHADAAVWGMGRGQGMGALQIPQSIYYLMLVGRQCGRCCWHMSDGAAVPAAVSVRLVPTEARMECGDC